MLYQLVFVSFEDVFCFVLDNRYTSMKEAEEAQERINKMKYMDVTSIIIPRDFDEDSLVEDAGSLHIVPVSKAIYPDFLIILVENDMYEQSIAMPTKYPTIAEARLEAKRIAARAVILVEGAYDIVRQRHDAAPTLPIDMYFDVRIVNSGGFLV